MNLYLPFVSAYAIPQRKAILLQNLLQSIPSSLLFSYNPHFVGLPHASYSYSTISVPALSNRPMTAPGKLDAVRSKRRMPGLRGGAEQAVDSVHGLGSYGCSRVCEYSSRMKCEYCVACLSRPRSVSGKAFIH